MEKREVVRKVFAGQRPPYVPWHYQFTAEPLQLLEQHFGSPESAEENIDNHILELGSPTGFFEDLGNGRFRDGFGVVWNRNLEKDIGNVEGCVLPKPTLDSYRFPDPRQPCFFEDIAGKIARQPDRFRVFCIGFSLFERAWTLRGMENLMMDFMMHPDFVHQLFEAIANYNIAQVEKALEYDIDAVYFGDDWGQQSGLIMGKPYWDEFIRPQLERMYGAVRGGGRFLMIHSCGDVRILLDDLIRLGLNCFNPFQPEVMHPATLLPHYRGRLAFHGGLSTQHTLPHGSVEEVRAESRFLLELGKDGSYIFAPGHAVEGDVPLENILAFMEEAKAQRLSATGL